MTTEKVNFEEHLKKLKLEYSSQLPAKLQVIKTDWQQLITHWDHVLLTTLHRNIHSLIGTSGTFGFIDISKTARELETLIKPLKENDDSGFTPDDALKTDFDRLFLQLESFLPRPESPQQNNIAETPKTPAPKHGYPLSGTVPVNTFIYYLDDDIAAPELLMQNLGSYGFFAKHFSKLADFLAAVEEKKPQLVILDLVIPEANETEIFELAKRLKQQDIYVVILSSRDDFAPRLAAVRAMIDAYVLKPADVPSLVNTIRTLLKLNLNKPSHIIIVDDQDAVARYYAGVLESEEIHVTTLTDPTQLIKTLDCSHTDLMIFDLNMPDINGAELAAVVRQYEEYQSIPILFLSADTSLDKKTWLLQVGSDDLLSKDMPTDKLVSQVKSRMDRSKKLTTLMYQDSLTGLLNHAQIQLAADRVFQHCKRKVTKCVIGMIDIDKFKQVNDKYGHIQGDKVIKGLAQLLQQRLRSTDYIGRFGGEEFMLVLPDITINDAGKLLNNLRKAFSKIDFQDGDKVFNVSFSAGLAENTNMEDFMDQLRESDEALYRAKNKGRNLVCASLTGEN